MKRTSPLHDLLAAAGLPTANIPNPTVSGLTYDSRLIERGDLFFAIKGAHSDGHDFIAKAAAAGAAAVIAERAVSASVPVIVAPYLFVVMSKIAHTFYGRPSHHLPVIGITGTNGKTTSTYLIENILRANQKTCGVIGTVNYRIGAESWPAPNTTPFSVDVHRFLSLMVDKKADAGVMEVSSHALVMNRVDDVRFAVGVFMNLTQDHLDYHKTMEKYFEAKSKLFKRPEPVKAVVNVDDEYGRHLAEGLNAPITFGLSQDARLQATSVKCDLNGLEFKLKFPSGKFIKIQNNLLGMHNVSNCLGAAGALIAFGLSEDQVALGLNQKHAVPGRLERVEAGQKFVVAVDYAHTHDALSQVLTTLRNTGPRRLICVFGAGGDRDKTKRPKMGRVAVELADDVFVTSDNPRSETPSLIMKDIEVGIKETGKTNYTMIENREEAIHAAVKKAREGDIILIAGKGHENYQIYGTEKIHFSDFEAARKAIAS